MPIHRWIDLDHSWSIQFRWIRKNISGLCLPPPLSFSLCRWSDKSNIQKCSRNLNASFWLAGERQREIPRAGLRRGDVITAVSSHIHQLSMTRRRKSTARDGKRIARTASSAVSLSRIREVGYSFSSVKSLHPPPPHAISKNRKYSTSYRSCDVSRFTRVKRSLICQEKKTKENYLWLAGFSWIFISIVSPACIEERKRISRETYSSLG